nr:hypothetical protein [Tanacetum cinerariifolium]
MSSSSAPTDIEIITPTDITRGSPVFTPPTDDPYILVRQAYLPIASDNESESLEDYKETEEPQPLSPTSGPSLPNYTPATPQTDDESEPYETFETKVTSPHSSTPPADLTSPPSPQRPLLTQTSPTPTPPRLFYYHSTTWMAVRTHPTLCPGYSAKLTEVMALSPSLFCKRYRSSYDTLSSSSSLTSSLTLPPRKRYRGTFKLIADTETEGTKSEDEGTDSEDEETASEGQQQQAILAEDIAEDEPLGLGNRAAKHRALEQARDTVPSTFETSPSPVGTPTSPEWFLESLLVSPVIPLPVASPTPAAAGYTDAQRGALWQAMYEDQQKICDLRRQHVADQHEMRELKDRISALEQRMDRKEK